MLVHLVVTLAIAVALILMSWAAFRTLGKPMPRFMLPLLVGTSVLGYGIYSEYTWESRTVAALPPSMKMVRSHTGTSPLSPWSFIMPRSDRMSVMDTESARTNPDFPGMVMMDLLLFQRFSPIMRIRQMIDCRGSRRADLAADFQPGSNGLPDDLQWIALDGDDEILQIACHS